MSGGNGSWSRARGGSARAGDGAASGRDDDRTLPDEILGEWRRYARPAPLVMSAAALTFENARSSSAATR